jgi:hypothetical protein
MRALAVDLYCGLGGWTEGLLEAGYEVVGFDIERHAYGEHKYPAQLVLQDVLTIHGSPFKDAELIVDSPPCHAYSYRAMPWKRAKALPPPDNSLFEACFRIQREAIEAAGRFIPLVVENVRGAQPYVGRARGKFGSFYLWGDVPALLPIPFKAHKVPGFRFDGSGRSFQSASVAETGVKVGGPDWSKPGKPGYADGPGKCFRDSAIKNEGGSWFAVAHNTTSGKGRNPDGRKVPSYLNQRDGHSHTRHLTNPNEHGCWFKDPASPSRQGGSRNGRRTSARKMASAMIAKIPLALSRHVAEWWYPKAAA